MFLVCIYIYKYANILYIFQLLSFIRDMYVFFVCIYVYAYIRIQLPNFCGCLLCSMISYFISLKLNARSAWEAPKNTQAHYNKYFICHFIVFHTVLCGQIQKELFRTGWAACLYQVSSLLLQAVSALGFCSILSFPSYLWKHPFLWLHFKFWCSPGGVSLHLHPLDDLPDSQQLQLPSSFNGSQTARFRSIFIHAVDP